MSNENNEYKQAIEQSKANLADVCERGLGGMKKWSEVKTQLYSEEEIREINLRVAIIGELIKARQEKNISQRELEQLSGVKQPVISRMENGTNSPHLDTVLKVLAPLGKTLAVVPLEKCN